MDFEVYELLPNEEDKAAADDAYFSSFETGAYGSCDICGICEDKDKGRSISTCDDCNGSYCEHCQQRGVGRHIRSCDVCDCSYCQCCREKGQGRSISTCDDCEHSYCERCEGKVGPTSISTCDACDCSYCERCEQRCVGRRICSCDACDCSYCGRCQEKGKGRGMSTCDACDCSHCERCQQKGIGRRIRSCNVCDCSYCECCPEKGKGGGMSTCDVCDCSYCERCKSYTGKGKGVSSCNLCKRTTCSLCLCRCGENISLNPRSNRSSLKDLPSAPPMVSNSEDFPACSSAIHNESRKDPRHRSRSPRASKARATACDIKAPKTEISNELATLSPGLVDAKVESDSDEEPMPISVSVKLSNDEASRQILDVLRHRSNVKTETSEDVQVSKVLLRDIDGQPIDFGARQLTTETLLNLMAKEFEARKVKMEYIEPPQPRQEVLAVSQLLSQHDSIAHCFQDGSRFEDLIEELGKHGPEWPLSQRFLHLDAMDWPGWGTIVINNRRLHCLQEHQKRVPWTVCVRVNLFSLPQCFVDLMESAPIYWKFVRGLTTWHGQSPRVRRPPPGASGSMQLPGRRRGGPRLDLHGTGSDPETFRPEDSVSNVGVAESYVKNLTQAAASTTSFGSYSSSGSLVCVPNSQHAVGGRCFLEHALFKMPDRRFVLASDLGPDAAVLSANGSILKVISHQVHPMQEQNLVQLWAGSAVLTVTASHRVMVQRGDTTQTLQAESLRVGETVFCSGERTEKITSPPQKFTAHVRVVEVWFSPDEPVEAFSPLPDSIQSKGQGRAKTARRSKVAHKMVTDRLSIPDTDDGWD